jgi:phosphoribosylformylglycinamidine synthase
VGSDGKKHAIPGTLLISALAIVPDVAMTTTSDLKAAGDRLYVMGRTHGEMGGSALSRLRGLSGGTPPQPPAQGLDTFRRLHRAMRRGLVRACHDCSEGGVAVAVAEMALGGGIGLELRLGDLPHSDGVTDAALAFSESLGRFIVEVPEAAAARFEAAMTGALCAFVGRVRADDRIVIIGSDGNPIIETDLAAIERAWRGHLR